MVIPLIDLPVLTSLAPLEPPLRQPDAVLRAEGPDGAFAELLAGQGAIPAAPVPEQARGEGGKDLPDPAEQSGTDMPDMLPQPVALADFAPTLPQALLLVLPVPQAEPAAGGPQGDAMAPFSQERPRPTPVQSGAVSVADDLDLPLSVSEGGGERVPSPAGDARGAAPVPEAAAQVARPVEAFAPITALRESAPVTTALAAAPPVPAISGTELAQLVEVLAQAREAGRGARGELALRHAEFGTVAIRLAQAEGETRATLAGRDPGFAPAVVAALSERAATGSPDQQSAPQHHRGGEPAFASGQGDSRQPDRRSVPERFPATHANPSPRDSDPPGESESRSGRFA